jgi:xylulokinase
VEQDVDQLVSATMKAMREAVVKSGVKSESIASVSISAQRCCGIFLDSEERLLRPMISWQDNRSSSEVKEIAEKIDPAALYGITGFPNSTTWLLSKMMWVRRNEPEVWRRTRRVVQMHDYFMRALGTEDYYVDHNDAGFFALFDVTKQRWSEKLLSMFSIDEAILPNLSPSCSVIGKVSKKGADLSGLAPGTVIATGAGDQSAGSLGAGIVKKGCLSISMGTAGAVTAFLDKPFRDPEGRMMVTNCTIKDRWLLEGYQAAAAGVYRWFKDEIATLETAEAARTGGNPFDLINDLARKSPAGAKGLVFLPYFASAGTPRYNSDARGVLLGLTFAHDRASIARAFMEGITLDMRDMIEGIKKAGVPVTDVRILGGPTKSSLWNQIQTDIYGVPVRTLKVTDATVLGAAIMGGVGAGIFSSIEEGVTAMVKTEKTYEPDKGNRSLYDDMYETFCAAYESLDKGRVFAGLTALQKRE